ncbi:MAG: hypothetical protein ACO4AU_10070 [bacterium]
MYRILQRTLLALGALWLTALPLHAQTNYPNMQPFEFERELVSGFSEDGRIKILLLTLLPTGMTESAVEEISKALQMNLFNTNHFTVVGPGEWNAQIQERDPTLADCYDVSCGIRVGKLFNADKVLVGNITTSPVLDQNGEEIPGMLMTLKMVDVITNITDFEDEVQFTDAQMHEALFRLATRVSQNTLLRGFILSVRKDGVTLDLGRAHGLKPGNQVVIFRPISTNASLEGQPLELSNENIAIAELIRVNDMSSDALVVQRFSAISAGDQVKTFINVNKRVALISEARRELDTRKRLQPKTKPLQLTPEVVVADTGREEWARRVVSAKQNQERWMYVTAGAGIATIVLLTNGSSIIDGDLGNYLPWFTGGAALYAGYQYMQSQRLLDELTVEGRSRGFLGNLELQWTPAQGPRLLYSYSF